MVSQQTHPIPRTAQFPRLDASRILGLSSTLALNVLALSFLLMPMTLPTPPAVEVDRRDLEVIDIVPVVRKTPPPPPIVPVVRPRPEVPPQPAMPRAATPTPDAPVLVDRGIPVLYPVAPTPAESPAPPALAPTGPEMGLQLQYASAPAPAYPRAALQRQLEGTVLLRVLVGIDGRPLEVQVERSSGHSVLDREAVRHVQRSWRFQPALRDGQAVQAVGLVPIDFRLDRG
ncbi:energy transducer TonB [Luteimonas kalidii]|uniref:Protein TonB n=1 Tax=Luteimonas kalidii TaxID=3042025 RepID=A0ABT6JYB7_9GAMM|nr:TonB family protein [Luteimonas kalidii]MDH5835687.1 TonB family protein [Luteimonas kalidii]